MGNYIILSSWTDQGIRKVKDSPKRLKSARILAKKMGCKLKDFYMTIGDHDMVVLAEAPNDEAMAKLILAITATGNIRTTTLKAFSEADYKKIVGGI